MDRDLEAARGLVIQLAVEVGRLQLDQRSEITGLEIKAHANDFVSHVDIASEQRIVQAVLETWPDDGILGEEGNSVAGTSDWHWVIDPLDGTRNYLTASGPWSVSIALQHRGQTVLGVVHDPALNETFSAVRGSGATLNGSPIRSSTKERLAEAIVGFSFNPSPATKVRMAQIISELLPVVGDIRRVPSALGLSYLASGRFDCLLALDTKLWDIAAAELIAFEGGATLGGSPGVPSNELTAGAGAELWSQLAAALEPDLGQLTPFA